MTKVEGQISCVRPEDFPRILEVWEASVRATHTFLSEADIQFIKPLVPDAIASVPHLACMRDVSDHVVGFIGVEGMKVEMLFVHPTFRGQGIGTRLLKHAIKTQNARLVDVNEQNDQAVGFYLRMGFEIEGRSELDSTGKPFPLLHMRLKRHDEPRPPCLYMLWSNESEVRKAVVIGAYTLRPYVSSDEQSLRELLEIDGEAMGETEWQAYRDSLLPNGLFVVEHEIKERLVATAGAAHNPNPGRCFFPFGGELGYLIVDPGHRQRGLGTAVCSAVVQRFISAGYGSIRVCVQEHRIPAIRTYLRVGFVPFLHSEEVSRRWQQVFSELQLPFTPELWPHDAETRSTQ